MNWESPEIIWFVVGLVLILLEFAIPGLITVFFGIGAWIVALICLLVPLPLNTQLFIFIILSILSLLFLRKWFRKLFVRRLEAVQISTDELEDDITGQEAVVVARITPKKHGRVEFRGSTWNATAKETIAAGRTVKIIGKKNITLVVELL